MTEGRCNSPKKQVRIERQSQEGLNYADTHNGYSSTAQSSRMSSSDFLDRALPAAMYASNVARHACMHARLAAAGVPRMCPVASLCSCLDSTPHARSTLALRSASEVATREGIQEHKHLSASSPQRNSGTVLLCRCSGSTRPRADRALFAVMSDVQCKGIQRRYIWRCGHRVLLRCGCNSGRPECVRVGILKFWSLFWTLLSSRIFAAAALFVRLAARAATSGSSGS